MHYYIDCHSGWPVAQSSEKPCEIHTQTVQLQGVSEILLPGICHQFSLNELITLLKNKQKIFQLGNEKENICLPSPVSYESKVAPWGTSFPHTGVLNWSGEDRTGNKRLGQYLRKPVCKWPLQQGLSKRQAQGSSVWINASRPAFGDRKEALICNIGQHPWYKSSTMANFKVLMWCHWRQSWEEVCRMTLMSQ